MRKPGECCRCCATVRAEMLENDAPRLALAAVQAERERCLTLVKNMADHAYELHAAIESGDTP